MAQIALKHENQPLKRLITAWNSATQGEIEKSQEEGVLYP
jgi:hypothetical protein